MKQTALTFVTEYLLEKFKTFSIKDKETILGSTSFESWEEFESEIKTNQYDLVEWAIVELPNWKGLENILPSVKIVQDGFESDEGDFCVFEIDGKFIKILYSNFERMCFRTIEFDFVEQVEILVPTKTWQIIK